ncbi:MAG: 4-hydroxy-3-methylbut-2-enyl diphosphate reductase [Alphaproteobacteria bacterium]|nr:4-hydroxy-3-methylbut-2-enyl diphosphate reductase [Alphaproteobacteria bacterium]
MESSAQGKPEGGRLTLLLAAPRGFCAGVERAIRIVELSLQKYGAPVYVRHEIVHNRYVVERLERMGAVFIDDLSQAPDDAKVIFSAHGVPKSVPAEAKRRGLFYLNATCPLVSKVHVEAERHFAAGRHVLLIGHAGHPEVEGTLGQLPDGAITLVETAEEARAFVAADSARLAFVTQTTLSVDDTEEIVAVLRRRFPSIAGPHREDICYATTNRQEAIKRIAPRAGLVLVIGAPNSSNSLRLVEVALRSGARNALLIQRAGDIDWTLFDGVTVLGLSAGASTPDILIDEVIAALRERFDLTIEETSVTREDVVFNVPRALAS